MENLILDMLTESQRAFLLGAAMDGTGGLAAELTLALVGTARKALRDRYREEPQQVALREAVTEALAAALHLWALSEEEATHYFGLFAAWVKNDEVVQEFRQFLAPRDDLYLDIELLQELFEEEGLEATMLLSVSFEELVQDMVGAFYEAAARKPDLQGVLEIGLLRQVVERLGALKSLEALNERLVAQGQRSANLLSDIRGIEEKIHLGQRDVIGLLEKILKALTQAQSEGPAELLLAYAVSRQALDVAEVPVAVVGPSARAQLRLILSKRFDGTELRTLCFDLNVSMGDLSGDSDSARALSLLEYLERRERLPELIIWGRANRPDIDWPPLVEIVTPAPSVGGESLGPLLTPILALLSESYRRLNEPRGPSDEELLELERPYRRHLIERFEKLTFRGISRRALVLPLEKIYVELKAVADVPQGADSYSAEERRLFAEAEGRGLDESELRRQLDTLRLERWREASRARSERLTRRSIKETLSDPTQRGVVILGDPGSGKTTLLHYLALQAARQPVGETLPIFVPLAAYDDFIRRHKQEAPPPLGDFLALYYERTQRLPGLGPLFARALHEGRALVLLDGLDEVLDPFTRQTVAQQASALIAAESGAGNRFALTSRVVGYREAPLSATLPHVTVLDFGAEEIATFAEQWCHTYEEWVTGHASEESAHRAEQEKAGLLDDVRSNPSVERLAANPLLLTMLALLRRQEGQKLPDRRVELYEKYVKALVDNWQQVRSEGARSEAPDRFDPHEAIEHLIELALWLQQHKPSGTTPLREMERTLQASCLRLHGHEPGQAPRKAQLEATQRAEAFIHDMRHFAGLLAERGQDAFGFLHLTFQEYFAGRALARLEPEARWAILRDRLHEPRWREPLLLCAGQLGVLEHRRDQASELAVRVLEAESEHEELLHRDLFLAAAIAADDVGLAPALLDRLCDQLIPLQQSNIPTLRDNALNALARLARIGHAPAIAALHESLKDETLWYDTMQALKPVLADERCVSLRDAVFAALQDSDWNVRAAAVAALARLASSHSPTLDALLAATRDNNQYVRAAAVWALWNLTTSHTPTYEALLIAIYDSAGYVRAAAVGPLARLAASHPPTYGTLLQTLRDSDGYVRAAAVRALGKLAVSHPSTHDTLLQTLHDSDWNVRAAVVGVLGGMIVNHPPTHEVLLHTLRDDRDGYVRAAAAEALGAMAACHRPTYDALFSALRDNNWNVRAATLRALADIAVSETAVLEAFIHTLEDSKVTVQVAAAGVLAKLVTKDPAARISLLNYPQKALHEQSFLSTSGDTLREAAFQLARILDERPVDMRWLICLVIAAYFVNDENPTLSQKAINVPLMALDFFAPNTDGTSFVMQAAGVREEAARLLSMLTYRDATIFSRLARVLDEDENERVRDAAFGALLRLAAAPERAGGTEN